MTSQKPVPKKEAKPAPAAKEEPAPQAAGPASTADHKPTVPALEKAASAPTITPESATKPPEKASPATGAAPVAAAPEPAIAQASPPNPAFKYDPAAAVSLCVVLCHVMSCYGISFYSAVRWPGLMCPQ